MASHVEVIEAEDFEIVNLEEIPSYFQQFIDVLKYCWFWLIMNRYTIAAATATVGITGAYFFRNYTENITNDDIERLRTIRQKALIAHENELKKLKDALEKQQHEELYEDAKWEAQFKQKQVRNKEKIEEDWEILNAQSQKDQLSFSRRKLEGELKIQKLQDQLELQNLLKSQTDAISNYISQERGKQELRDLEDQRKKYREAHIKEMDAIGKNMEQQRKDFEKGESARKQAADFEQKRFQKRMKEIQEEMEKNLEELRREDYRRREEMEHNICQIRMMLRTKMQIDQIEANWTRRLNSLRSTYEPVRKAYSRMKQYSREERPNSGALISNVLVAVENQKELMNKEKHEMENLHREYNKPFLLTIRDSVEEVGRECDRLIYVLKYEPSNSARIDHCVSALSRISNEIPTISELKSQMNQE